MGFADDGQAVLQERLPEIQDRIADYVGRVLVKEGLDREEAAQIRHFRDFPVPEFKTKLLDASQVSTCQRLVIIGDAGSGKSYMLQQAYSLVVDDFLQSPQAPFPFFLDLYRDLSREHSLEKALDFRYHGLFSRIRKEHGSGCILFLDALDERLSNEPNPFDFVNDLLILFDNHDEELRSIVMACRRAAWNPGWFSPSGFAWDVYHTDYLGSEDYAGIIPDKAARQEFFAHASSLGIADLLGLPFFGFDLARTYRRGIDLPQSRQEWYQNHIRSALKGSERDRKHGQAPPMDTLLGLSRQLACLATFCGMSTWTEQEAVDQLGASRVLSSVLGPITFALIQVLLQRPLFTKSDGRFSFSHQLFREFLATEALSPLSLRKQRQLLETPLPSFRYQILTPRRGMAGYLAEMSPKFCKHLIKRDPLTAFLAELPSASTEAYEDLTKAVIDKAIATHRSYWTEIPPRGKRLGDLLTRYRPRDIASFVSRYLERSDEAALIWGTACTKAWGGCTDLNARLVDLAHNDKLNIEIRMNAVDAVVASGDRENVRELYDLLDSRDDRIRGHVLRAYRMIESPTPRDFIAQLHGGAYDDTLHYLLQTEAESFGLSLDTEGLREAFREITIRPTALGSLRPDFLAGLFYRATQLEFDEIPPSLIVDLWTHDEPRHYHYGEMLRELVSGAPRLFAEIWNYVMDELGQEDSHLLHLGLQRYLAEACSDQVLDLLPIDPNTLNRNQKFIISEVLNLHFNKEPTEYRLEVFREKSPAYTSHLQIPQPTIEAISRVIQEGEAKIGEILDQEESGACRKSRQILIAIARMLHGSERHRITAEEVSEFLSTLPASLLSHTLRVFEVCILEEFPHLAEGTVTDSLMTPLQFTTTFWVLWNRGVRFSPDRLDEFIRYCASSRLLHETKFQPYSTLLDELHDLAPERWSETIKWLPESHNATSYEALEYLVARESDIYLERCRQRLCQCDFSVVDFSPLLDYWVARKPHDFAEVLRSCRECAQNENQGTAILYHLLAENDDSAWKELHRRIEVGLPPLASNFPPQRSLLQLPRDPLRLPALADWYACAVRDRKSAWRPYGLDHVLLETIVSIGGKGAIEQLQRLQEEKAFPSVEWLSSHAILRIEDHMLSFAGDPMEPGQLIDFINQEAFGIVLNEHDLFEWVCQAIEDERDGLEGLGEQIHGYWNCCGNDWLPKEEVPCQNVLWPALRRRLDRLGIVGVAERPIRADRADFWVEKPFSNGKSLRMAIELKVARKDYSRQRLVTPVETQLWQKYLQPSGCQHGIYVVLWFKDNQRFPYPRTWETPDELLGELDSLKQTIMKRNPVNLACYVIDMTTPVRMR